MPLEPSAQDKRGAILCAARGLLASLGFHGFSIKQVAEKAGVATGTVYLYFKDREDLIQQLRTEIIRAVARQLFSNYDPHLALAEQYRRICRNYWQYCVDNPDVLSCKAQFDHLPPEILRHQLTELKEVFQPLHEIFARGRRLGQIKDLPDEVLSSLAIEPLGALASKQMLGLLKLEPETLESVIDASWDAITHQGL